MIYKNRDLTLDEKRIVRYVKDDNLRDYNNAPEKADPRMYLMNLLFYTFRWTDAEIASLLNRERTTITNGRKKAFERESIKEKTFISNTHVLRFMFPDCKLKKDKNFKKKDNRSSFTCKLTKSRTKKLQNLKKEHGLYNYNDAVVLLIDKYL